MVSTVGLPGSPEETKKMEAKQEGRSNLRTPQTNTNTMEDYESGGHKVLLQVHHSRKQHVQPHLVTVYLVSA